MRLIDADAVKTVDYSGLSYIAPNDYQGIAEYFYKQLISYQPTAYDVDKIMAKLKGECATLINKKYTEDECHMFSKGAQAMYLRCEKIVKGAVKE